MYPSTTARCEYNGRSVPTIATECRCARLSEPLEDAPSLGLVCDLPDAAYLELTLACNNRCLGCSNYGFIADMEEDRPSLALCKGVLDGQAWGQILDKLGASVKHLYLTGGEPTLHPEFQTIVTAIADREIDFVLFTNGRWREPRPLLSFLIELPTFKGFLISMHGASPDSHEAFTGVRGSFDETVANIRLAIRFGSAVSTSTIITRQNAQELDRIVALSRHLGARAATFNRYLAFSTPVRSNGSRDVLAHSIPSAHELRTAVVKIEHLRTKMGQAYVIDYGPCIPQCFASSCSQGCGAGERFLVVDPWGNVKPCTDTVLHCGSLVSQSLHEVWWSEQMQYWRGLVPSACVDCPSYAVCHAGCRAMALNSGLGYDPLMPEELVSEMTL